MDSKNQGQEISVGNVLETIDMKFWKIIFLHYAHILTLLKAKFKHGRLILVEKISRHPNVHAVTCMCLVVFSQIHGKNLENNQVKWLKNFNFGQIWCQYKCESNMMWLLNRFVQLKIEQIVPQRNQVFKTKKKESMTWRYLRNWLDYTHVSRRVNVSERL